MDHRTQFQPGDPRNISGFLSAIVIAEEGRKGYKVLDAAAAATTKHDKLTPSIQGQASI